MHILRANHLQQTVVVGDDNTRGLGRRQFVHAFGHDAHGIDVEPGVGLVENGKLRFEHGHLENLVALLLAAAKPFVHRTVGEFGIQFHNLSLFTHQFQEVGGLQRFLAFILSLCIDGCLHEVGHRHTGNLYRILEREEQSLVGTVLGFHFQQVLAVEPGLSLGHLIERVTYEHSTQR